ncbi:hypothetical protein D3C80_1688150 [compost metagenome]
MIASEGIRHSVGYCIYLGDALLDTPSGTLGNSAQTSGGVMFKLSEKQGVTRLRRLTHNKQASMYRFLAPEHTECEEHTPIKESGKRGAHLMLSEKKNKKPMLLTPHKAPHSTSTNSEFYDLASETEPLPIIYVKCCLVQCERYQRKSY